MPVRTEIGSLTPNGAPSTFSRSAITEPNAVEAAKAAAAMTSGPLTLELGERSAASVMTTTIDRPQAQGDDPAIDVG